MAAEQNIELGVLIDLLRIHPEDLQTFVNSSNKDEFTNSESFISHEGLSLCRVEPSVASCSKSFSTEVFLSEVIASLFLMSFKKFILNFYTKKMILIQFHNFRLESIHVCGMYLILLTKTEM